MMRAGWDLQVNSGDSSSSEDESVSASSDEGTAETVSYLDMLLKESPSPENNERDHGSEDSFNRVQTPVESGAEASSKNEGYEENDHYSGNGKTPKNNNLGFWDDAEMTFTSFEEEMVALESFLNCHHKKRLSSRSSSSQKEVRKDVEIDTEDYVNYMRLNSSSSNAIRQTFLYCLRTDDIKLADLLLRDVGIEFILRHCMLYDGVFNDGSSSSTPDLSGSTATENRKTSTANLFWLAALHGADGVLNMIAEQCLVYFIEAYTGGCEESEEVVEKAKDDFATILNNNVSVSDCLPLYVAAAKNHASVIRTLLKFGTNPNDTCQGKKSAAIIAASNNNLLALQALGESEKIDFNWADEKSLTPMLAACRNGCVDAVRFLTHYSGNETQQSVNCSRQDLKGYGCASLAARYNHQEVVIFLSQVHNPDSKVGIDINQRNRYSDEIALHVAAEYNCREVVRSLLEMIPCYCDVGARNQHHMTALHIAASHGHVGIVTEFVSSVSTELISELDTHDQFGMTPLFYAVYKGYTDCVKLLGPFSDVNKLCYAPITRKGTMHNVDDSNAPGKKSSSLLQPPLVLASSHGYTDIVVTLLHLQADPNLADVRGNTALVVAAEEGHLEVVEILMTQDVDVKIRSKVGKVAIHKARKNKHIEIVDYLENFILR